MKRLITLALFALAAFAQTPNIPWDANSLIDGHLGQMRFPERLFAGLPAAATGNTGWRYTVTDCLTSACTAGGGSTVADVRSTGSAWAVVSRAGSLYRTCIIEIGADNGSALGTADIAPQGRQCFVPVAAHVVEITVAADAGTPSVVVAKNHAGTLTDLSASLATAASGGLACANAAGSGTGIDGATTCTVALTGGVPVALAAGDWIETHTSASASTAKRMSIAITYTVD